MTNLVFQEQDPYTLQELCNLIREKAPKLEIDWLLLSHIDTFYRKTATNLKNPYHNLLHCQLVCANALHIISKEGPYLSLDTVRVLTAACMFHDYNHSGRPYTIVKDSVNIEDAKEGFLKFSDEYDFFDDYDKSTVLDLISVTEYDGKYKFFPNEPVGYLQKVIRDADLSMGSCGVIGLTLISNIPIEMGIQITVESFRITNLNFLKSATAFTSVGAEMLRDSYKACSSFFR